jgi:Ankyrin repeat
MHVRGTDAIPLEPHADVDRYRRVANDLLAARRNDGAAAIRQWAAAWMERLTALQRLTPTPIRAGEIAGLADGIVRDVTQTQLLASGTARYGPELSDAQLVIARLHGFENWQRFVEHIEGRGQASSPIFQFESAADAIVTGNLAALAALLAASPTLIRARSSREHDATLLHYIAANGHEGFRQLTPANAVQIARLLLDLGADPDALADMYGHSVTPMQMLVSSTPPHDAGLQVPLVEALLDFGANPNGVEDNGSPIMTACAFHFPRAAEALARRGARVDNVVAAAALGRADLVEQYVDDHGRLRAGLDTASGPWPTLSGEPAEQLGYALTWATVFGRDDVVALLLRKGVDPSGHDGDASALHFAAAYGRMGLARLLLRHGASLEAVNSYGGTVLDGVVWYALNAPIAGVDYVSVVRELIDLGARTDVYPDMKRYVELVLAGRLGGGYPSGGESE